MSELISSQESQPVQEKRITIDWRTLVLPVEAQEQLRELDQMITDHDYASEIGGFGLIQDKDNISKVVEIVLPDPQKIFKIDMIFRSVEHEILTEMLSKADSLSFSVVGNGAVLHSNEAGREGKWILFTQKGHDDKIDWTWAKKEIQNLVGFQLPPTVKELEHAVHKRKKELGQEDPSLELSLPGGYDAIVSPSSVHNTEKFMARVQARAQDTGTRLGFSMHHHPSLALLALVLQDKSLSQRENAYNELLRYSENDIRMMQFLGIDFFEIRAFGNPNHPFVHKEGTTSRFYRTESILAKDVEMRKKILG